jgi:hypothetical protein
MIALGLPLVLFIAEAGATIFLRFIDKTLDLTWQIIAHCKTSLVSPFMTYTFLAFFTSNDEVD